MASGNGFTQAALFLDGHARGEFKSFGVQGDGTEGTAASGIGGGVPDAIRVDWTTLAARSTTGNTFQNITVTNMLWVTGFSLEGTSGRQLDGQILHNVFVLGSQWQVVAGARTDTTGCGWTGAGNTV